MQEKSFEKQVQQKMEELSFTPSAPVWQKVEAQIRKKKERRRLLLWLLPLLLLTGGAVWFSYQGNISNKTTANIAREKAVQAPVQQPVADGQSTSQPKNTNPAEENTNTAEANKNVASTAEKATNTFKDIPSTAAVAVTNKNEDIRKKSNLPATETAPLHNKKGVTKNKQTDFKDIQNNAVSVNVAPEDTTATKGNEAIAVLKTPAQPIDKTVAQPVDKIAAEQPVTNDSAAVVIKEIKDSVPVQPQKIKKGKQWHWSVVAGVGASKLGKGLFSSFGAKSLALYDAPPLSNSGGNFSSPPAQPTRGLSFSAGVQGKKAAGKNSFFTAGLQYSYYSTRLMVGTAVDSAISLSSGRQLESYYRNNTRQTTYTNGYHFIELPVGFEYRLLKNVPLKLHHGFSIGYLFASNALHYNSRANVYYKDNSLLRKSSISFFSSMDYRLLNGKNLVLHAGPQLQYGLSRLQKNSSAHLFSTGLSLKASF